MNISFNETREISVPALKVFQASKHKDIVKVNQMNRAVYREVTIVNRVNPREKKKDFGGGGVLVTV